MKSADSLIVVDFSDLRVCREPDKTLVTYSLGSCMALMLYDPVRRIGGMLHYVHPLSISSPPQATRRPAMFADTGVPLLIELMISHGAGKSDLRASAAGGAILLGSSNMYNIGQRNLTVLRKTLWRNDMLLDSEDVGGTRSRTAALHVGSGKIVVRSQGDEAVLS